MIQGERTFYFISALEESLRDTYITYVLHTRMQGKGKGDMEKKKLFAELPGKLNLITNQF